jgi:hypothetical protein
MKEATRRWNVTKKAKATRIVMYIIPEFPCFCPANAYAAVNVESRDPSKIESEGPKCMPISY